MRLAKNAATAPFLVLAIFVMALVFACGGENQSATGLTDQERLLSWLPSSTTEFVYVDIETVSGRPDFQDEVESWLNNLLAVTGDVFNEELLRSAKISKGAFGFNSMAGRDADVYILQGDFQQLLVALEQTGAGGSDDRLEIEVIEVYRGIEIFTISRPSGLPPFPVEVFMGVTDRDQLALAHNLKSVKTNIDQYLDTGRAPDPFFGGLQTLVQGSSSPFENETYRGVVIYRFQSSPEVFVAVANLNTLVLGFAAETVREIIDQVQDGGEVPEILREFFGDPDQADFLYAVPFHQQNPPSPERPFSAITLTSWAVFLKEDLTSTVRIGYFFEEPEAAAEASAWLQEQGDLKSGFAGGVSLEVQARQEGRAVLIEAIVPDEAVIGLIVGD